MVEAPASPPRRIVGFHLDDEGQWVARLECGHHQHVRHNPPWVSRPWVITPEGRAKALGETLACKKCAAGAPPDPQPSSPELRFEPIDLDSAADIAIAFRADSFVCSFGSAERFYEADGKGHERYLAWLRERMRSIPGSCVHVWSGATIVGQIEMGRLKDEAELGYVSLYYLAPAYRNRGLGRRLDEYVTALLREQGFRAARLHVSPTNEQALRFYRKNGWLDLGPSAQHPYVHVMEKKLS